MKPLAVLVAAIVIGVLAWMLTSGASAPPEPDPPSSTSTTSEHPPAEPPPPRTAQKREEVISAPPVTTKMIAPTVSAPTLTLAGHLVKELRDKSNSDIWCGDPKRVPMPVKNAAMIAKSKQFNPDGKQLSVEQERELQSLATEFDDRYRPLHATERKATHEALIRAASIGQIESIDIGPNPGISDPVGANRYMEKMQEASQERMDRLSERFGRENWTWSAIPSFEPDGVYRNNIVYLMRATEGEVFAMRERKVALIRERHAAYRQFFGQLK